MRVLAAMTGVGLLLTTTAWGDLVSLSSPSAGGAVKVSAASEAASSAAALSVADARTNTKSNFVYYASLDGGGDTKIDDTPDGGKDGNGGTNTGGGDGGSANGGGIKGGNGGVVPAPAASILALIGMACVSWFRRRL